MTGSPDDQNPIAMIKPSAATIERSLQSDLFCTFHGLPADLSNTVELWDAIPKYIVSARTQAWAALKDKRLPLYKQTFHYEPQPRQKGRTQQLLVTDSPGPLRGGGRDRRPVRNRGVPVGRRRAGRGSHPQDLRRSGQRRARRAGVIPNDAELQPDPSSAATDPEIAKFGTVAACLRRQAHRAMATSDNVTFSRNTLPREVLISRPTTSIAACRSSPNNSAPSAETCCAEHQLR
jgi:hypothetical protein